MQNTNPGDDKMKKENCKWFIDDLPNYPNLECGRIDRGNKCILNTENTCPNYLETPPELIDAMGLEIKNKP